MIQDWQAFSIGFTIFFAVVCWLWSVYKGND